MSTIDREATMQKELQDYLEIKFGFIEEALKTVQEYIKALEAKLNIVNEESIKSRKDIEHLTFTLDEFKKETKAEVKILRREMKENLDIKWEHCREQKKSCGTHIEEKITKSGLGLKLWIVVPVVSVLIASVAYLASRLFMNIGIPTP